MAWVCMSGVEAVVERRGYGPGPVKMAENGSCPAAERHRRGDDRDTREMRVRWGRMGFWDSMQGRSVCLVTLPKRYLTVTAADRSSTATRAVYWPGARVEAGSNQSTCQQRRRHPSISGVKTLHSAPRLLCRSSLLTTSATPLSSASLSCPHPVASSPASPLPSVAHCHGRRWRRRRRRR